ncbi:hypothetical protein WG66_016224 [Moniliophthora roreri]|nr:hypothetical protein WG66_016224 [Moniliophthora roreri]
MLTATLNSRLDICISQIASFRHPRASTVKIATEGRDGEIQFRTYPMNNPDLR